MKFTVEVEDFYLDGEELSSSLVEMVKREVVSAIKKNIEQKVDDAVRIAVQAKIEQELTLQINLRVSELIASGKIIKGGDEISITDHIKQQFEKNSGWNSPYEQIKAIAKTYGDEMKKRYDFLYANQIVQQMHVIGIIKEEIYNNLIEKKSA
jgi:hypothetical protein